MSAKGSTTIWNAEKDALLREMYPNSPCSDIAPLIGCSDYTVSLRAKKLGLKRAPDYNQYAFKGRYTRTGRYKTD